MNVRKEKRIVATLPVKINGHKVNIVTNPIPDEEDDHAAYAVALYMKDVLGFKDVQGVEATTVFPELEEVKSESRLRELALKEREELLLTLHPFLRPAVNSFALPVLRRYVETVIEASPPRFTRRSMWKVHRSVTMKDLEPVLSATQGLVVDDFPEEGWDALRDAARQVNERVQDRVQDRVEGEDEQAQGGDER